jgi:hypothetical protein
MRARSLDWRRPSPRKEHFAGSNPAGRVRLSFFPTPDAWVSPHVLGAARQ